MSDMACWRQGELESEHIVVRLFGSERVLTLTEARELNGHLCDVLAGAFRSVGEGYQNLCDDYSQFDPDVREIDLRSVGLAKPAPIMPRRPL